MPNSIAAHDTSVETTLRAVGFRVDASSWVSWVSFTLAFALTVIVCPGAANDMRVLDWRTALLLLSVAQFFAAIVLIQWRMQLALKAQSFGQPKRLHSSGIFGMSRNPMYVCFLLPLLAWALWSPLASALSIVFYVTVMNLLVIRREEMVLRGAFGEEYEVYAKRVPRWVLPLG